MCERVLLAQALYYWIKQYLEAEVSHVLEKILPGDLVIEVGCGYRRTILRSAGKAGSVVGIVTSVP